MYTFMSCIHQTHSTHRLHISEPSTNVPSPSPLTKSDRLADQSGCKGGLGHDQWQRRLQNGATLLVGLNVTAERRAFVKQQNTNQSEKKTPYFTVGTVGQNRQTDSQCRYYGRTYTFIQPFRHFNSRISIHWIKLSHFDTVV